MSQSLYTAMGGISAAQTQLNVISNNIANLNTTAFKSSSVNFSDVFSRTVSSGSVSTQSTGGTNPIQVGVGVRVSSISKDFNSGSWVPTNKPTDLMIQGLGFFTVESSDGEKFYTRAGDFSFDESGYLVTSSGYKLMGTDNILSSTTTSSNVYIPRSIIAAKTGNEDIASQLLTNLNNCDSITDGHFNIVVNNTDILDINLNTTANNTVGLLVNSIQTQIDNKATALQPLKPFATALTATVDAVKTAGTGTVPIPAAVTATITAITAAVNAANTAGAGIDNTLIGNITTAAGNARTAANTARLAGTMTQTQYDNINTYATQIQTLAATLSAGTAMTNTGPGNQLATFQGYVTNMTSNAALITTAADNAITALDALPAGTVTAVQYANILSAANEAKDLASHLVAGTTMTDDQRDSFHGYAGSISKLYDEYSNIDVICDDTTNGEIQFGIDGTYAQSLSFTNPTSGAATNFITATGLNNVTLDPVTSTYSSNVLDWTVSVGQVTSASLAASQPEYSINADGSIQAKYSNNDTLSVQLDATGTTYEFLYTTSEGIEISGTKCTVDTNLATPANFVIQMASITNTDGLLSVGSNLFKAGPNSGSIIYSVGGKLGLGKIESGGLEASNVDLSKEFSNMIVAQRAVQANSRVFTTTSNIMDAIVSMGR